MSDTTGWKKLGTRTLYKNLPHCRIEVFALSSVGYRVYIEPRDSDRPTKAEAQRLAHALARAIEDVK